MCLDIPEDSKTTSPMDKELITITLATNMWEVLKRTKDMVRERIHGKTVKHTQNMLGIGKTTKITDRVLNTLKMETNILAALKTICDTEKEHSFSPMEKNFLKNTSMAKPRKKLQKQKIRMQKRWLSIHT